MVSRRRKNASCVSAEALNDRWRRKCPSLNVGMSRHEQEQDPTEHREARKPHQPVQPLLRHLSFLASGNPRKRSRIPGQAMATPRNIPKFSGRRNKGGARWVSGISTPAERR
jgi:hypothetical protein